MTGSLPPTGKTPRAGGNPWSSAGRGAKWWNGKDDGPVAAPARIVPPAYGGDPDEPFDDANAVSGADPVDGTETEPDRYDEPTLDVLAEQEAETAQAETAQADPSHAGPSQADAAQAGPGAGPAAPADVDGPAVRTAAELREAPHLQVGPDRLPGYAANADKPARTPVAGHPTAGDATAGDVTADPAAADRAAGNTPGNDDDARVDPAGAEAQTAAEHDPDESGAERPTVSVPDVMILPEPGRERQTVAVSRGPVPGQSRADQAVDEPHLASSKLETSTFWLLGDETDESRVRDGSVWPSAPGHGRAGPAGRLGVPPRRRDRPRPPRRPAAGLPGLLVLGLAAMFFAWVSAGPFWLALGHGDRGTATVTRCTGDGFGQRCVGQFTADRGSFTATRVALMGVAAGQRAQGAVVPARMVDRQARQAYVGSAPLLLHLRWALGVVLMLLCGVGIAASTGARRLETARARRAAVLLSLAGPVALWAGFLAVTY